MAVIGAGMAGATCAHALAMAGHTVQVFDKARGPGGRMATRRMTWKDLDGRAWTTRLDHGALGITARSRAFGAWVDMGVSGGWLTRWSPRLAHGSRPLDDVRPIHLPVPDLPAVCRQLLEGSEITWESAVEALHHTPEGWQLQVGGERLGALFDAVLIAMPPAQAATLLAPHRPDWAGTAARTPMQACWTLMGVEALGAQAIDASGGGASWSGEWDLARPVDGPLAWVLRQDARPGRPQVAGQAHWVAHARTDWSLQHLEQSPQWVAAQMQAALASALGRPVDWLHTTVHRWRYGLPPVAGATPACWWDRAQGLGVCGDFLGTAMLARADDAGGDAGGEGLDSVGVEAAWLSGRALAHALMTPCQVQQTALVEALS
ncbi:hypothetical protein EV685_0757 [Sphaerotilus mobilis]|uniref:Amine oxidase domain-containing protein n=2 Tax=Sphaerotilus mobilis TaxID=47994 RepID=A0A4Q7LUG1_9BURK|nr:hypothetical protein EV685_0757 [Sphaerotilus mobilis]